MGIGRSAGAGRAAGQGHDERPAREGGRTVTVARVFTAGGRHGNALGILVDTADLADEACQEIAHRLGFSETVFVDEPAAGRCRIFTPTVQLPFAGHPMVGAAWLLGRRTDPPEILRPPAGEVAYGRAGEDWWVQALAAWCPPWQLTELKSPAAVLAAEPPGPDVLELVWAWTDRAAGTLRARAFATALGITEDEATGSAAIRLAVSLGRPVVITQGRGSRLVATPAGNGVARVGGRVDLDASRTV